jgi:hypothetical protein
LNAARAAPLSVLMLNFTNPVMVLGGVDALNNPLSSTERF